MNAYYNNVRIKVSKGQGTSKIGAIKALRNLTALSLKDSKDILDLCEQHGEYAFKISYYATNEKVAADLLNAYKSRSAAAGYPVHVTSTESTSGTIPYLKEALIAAVNDKDYHTAREILDIMIKVQA